MGTCNSKKFEYTNLKNKTILPPPPEYDECENNNNLNQLNELINQVKKIENKLTNYTRNDSWLSAYKNLYAYIQHHITNNEKMFPPRNYLHDTEIRNFCGNIMQTAVILKNQNYTKQSWTVINGLYTQI